MAKNKSTQPTAVKQRGNSAHIEAYQFKPGKSGNPNGRPKRETPSETLRLMLDAEYGVDAVKQLQKTMPEPWRSKKEVTVQEVMTWVILRRAMQNAGARREVFDRTEGRPTLKLAGPSGGPIETISHDPKKLSAEKIRLMREILAEAAVSEAGAE